MTFEEKWSWIQSLAASLLAKSDELKDRLGLHGFDAALPDVGDALWRHLGATAAGGNEEAFLDAVGEMLVTQHAKMDRALARTPPSARWPRPRA